MSFADPSKSSTPHPRRHYLYPSPSTTSAIAIQIRQSRSRSVNRTRLVGIVSILCCLQFFNLTHSRLVDLNICKVNSQLISNVCTDALCAEKYYYFIRLMGRKASHVAVECTLQSHPNMVILDEEVAASKLIIFDIIKQICDAVQAKAEHGSEYMINDDGFQRALYMIDICQNDLSDAFAKKYTYAQVIKGIPLILEEINNAIKSIHDNGGIKFWVHNTGQLRCMPQKLWSRSSRAEYQPLPQPYPTTTAVTIVIITNAVLEDEGFWRRRFGSRSEGEDTTVEAVATVEADGGEGAWFIRCEAWVKRPTEVKDEEVRRAQKELGPRLRQEEAAQTFFNEMSVRKQTVCEPLTSSRVCVAQT
ncbi:hypothetical protein R6Q59_030314 [Mikania micrantha]